MTEVMEKKYIKRAFRFPIDQYIMISDCTAGEKFHVLCRNISASGVLIENSELELELDGYIYIFVPSFDLRKNIKLTARIKRVSTKDNGTVEYGAHITFLNHMQLLAWSKFVGIKELYFNQIKKHLS